MTIRVGRTVLLVVVTAMTAAFGTSGCESDRTDGSLTISTTSPHTDGDATAALLSPDDVGLDYSPSDDRWLLPDSGAGINCLGGQVENTDPVDRAEVTYSPGDSPDQPIVYSAVETYRSQAELRAAMADFRAGLAECEVAAHEADDGWALSLDLDTEAAGSAVGIDDRIVVTATARIGAGDTTLVTAALGMSFTAVANRLAVVGVAGLGDARSELLARLTREASYRLTSSIESP